MLLNDSDRMLLQRLTVRPLQCTGQYGGEAMLSICVIVCCNL